MTEILFSCWLRAPWGSYNCGTLSCAHSAPKDCVCHSCDKTVRRGKTVSGQWLVSGSQGHPEGPARAQPLSQYMHKQDICWASVFTEREEKCPKGNHIAKGMVLAQGPLPTTSTPSWDCLASSS